ncbi:MAG: ribonuclease HII [Actinobacteria bacterium]|nr:ribonuclease HII [Actinomycetota bacterium]
MNLGTGLTFEGRLWESGFYLVAGVDEAGRGALAGPLIAAAAILPKGCELAGLDDSKLLTPASRERLYGEITATAVAWSVVGVEHEEIDRHGLQRANLVALERSIEDLSVEPDFVLSDAFPLRNLEKPRLAVIKGDQLSLTVAAASIIAKVTRDRIMVDYHQLYPVYRFDEHKGYSTPLHKSLIREHGPCPIHRRSFAPVSEACQLEMGY